MRTTEEIDWQLGEHRRKHDDICLGGESCEFCRSTTGHIVMIEALTELKNSAYSERNKLVALLSALYPSCLSRHPDEDKSWDDDWRWIVFINLPDGKGGNAQASWHIHDSELPMFDHLRKDGRYFSSSREPVIWDGHTTEEKYARVEFTKKEAADESGCPLCGDYR